MGGMEATLIVAKNNNLSKPRLQQVIIIIQQSSFSILIFIIKFLFDIILSAWIISSFDFVLDIPTPTGGTRILEEDKIVTSMRKKYEKMEIIGEGVYGTVFMAKDLTTNTIVALKKMRLEEEEEGIPATAIRQNNHI